jgi:hypothetical protein
VSPAGEKISGDVAVGLGDVQASLVVKVRNWGARCKLSCLGSEVIIDFHNDGGVELVDRSDQRDPQ